MDLGVPRSSRGGGTIKIKDLRRALPTCFPKIPIGKQQPLFFGYKGEAAGSLYRRPMLTLDELGFPSVRRKIRALRFFHQM